MRVVDGCTSRELTKAAIVELIESSDSAYSINRMPGIEARVLKAWKECGEDTESLITRTGLLLQLQQNTGFYAQSDFVGELDFWCKTSIRALRRSTLLYRLETAEAQSFDVLVDDFLDEIHVWSANRLHQWMPALEGLKVLACTPFADSAKQQLPHLCKLFTSGHTPFAYPRFDISFVKAHNTVLGNDPFPHSGWRETLEHTAEEILKHDFDLALLGCGSYGTPLCERIRAAGKNAFYIGSYCQLMFGIKGRRWENEGNPIGSYFNEYWRNPSVLETPRSFKEIEGGCYW